MRRIILAGLALCAVTTATLAAEQKPVAGQTQLDRCSAPSWMEHEVRRVYLGRYTASCNAQGQCRALTYVLAPNFRDWTHRLAFVKLSATAPWVVALTAETPEAAPKSDFALQVDRHKDVVIPASTISSPDALNEMRLTPEASASLVKDFLPAANVKWKYDAANGKSPQNATFSLIGLQQTLNWVDCIQKK